ncbi:hypothetical protein SPOG_02065 [Schizosaccharomyces cryophilus OY26]|uniref:Uncharacterized protein n=1 Tax=Schizosaccharomyces cryophilus (strain OY26 / ATCC MYA-4695 / CBS 11777 / NBRC 106824 / NRRL Y48691) TaxID=653667 RepID=S9W437_SCHCR|nr:uncharacterized protein SPOG_02065 [Schizosaccharomyces cryophilus OY26]EPY52745.1 hypothetical protein SPOG_02065 [Schizosaccharomyces cryophilus OY26]
MQILGFIIALLTLQIQEKPFVSCSIIKRTVNAPESIVLQTLHTRYWSFKAHVPVNYDPDSKGFMVHCDGNNLYMGESPGTRLLRVEYKDDLTLHTKDRKALVYHPENPLALKHEAGSPFIIEMVEERREPESPYLLFYSKSHHFTTCKENGRWIIYSGDLDIPSLDCLPIELVGIRYKGWRTHDKKPFALKDPGEDGLDTPWNDQLIPM